MTFTRHAGDDCAAEALRVMIARRLAVGLRVTGLDPADPGWDEARTLAWLPTADLLLADTELLDAIVASRRPTYDGRETTSTEPVEETEPNA